MVKRREFQRAYRFRFYPTPEQENLLRRTLGCARLVYNKALEARSEAWTSERRNVSYSDTSSMLTGWKKTDELSFLNDVSCVPLQQALRHLQRAFSGFFKQENAYPTFKKKTHGGSAEFTRSDVRLERPRAATRQNEGTVAHRLVADPAQRGRNPPR